LEEQSRFLLWNTLLFASNEAKEESCCNIFKPESWVKTMDQILNDFDLPKQVKADS
jgi:hypothetical protein